VYAVAVRDPARALSRAAPREVGSETHRGPMPAKYWFAIANEPDGDRVLVGSAGERVTIRVLPYAHSLPDDDVAVEILEALNALPKYAVE